MAAPPSSGRRPVSSQTATSSDGGSTRVGSIKGVRIPLPAVPTGAKRRRDLEEGDAERAAEMVSRVGGIEGELKDGA